MKKTKYYIIFLMAVPCMLWAQAQDAGVKVGDKPAPGEEVSALEFVMQGGPFLIPIVLLLFYTVSLESSVTVTSNACLPSTRIC